MKRCMQMHTSDFDYDLPEELIAQKPSEKRDICRLMVLDMEEKTVDHKHFYDILDYLHEGVERNIHKYADGESVADVYTKHSENCENENCHF